MLLQIYLEGYQPLFYTKALLPPNPWCVLSIFEKLQLPTTRGTTEIGTRLVHGKVSRACSISVKIPGRENEKTTTDTVRFLPLLSIFFHSGQKREGIPFKGIWSS